MTGILIEPNLHAVIVHFPLALLSVGLLIEVCSFIWPRSGIRTAGRWMIVLGILASIPAVTSGLNALRQTVAAGGTEDATWDVVVRQSTWTAEHWATLEKHITYVAGGALMMLIGIVIWIASSDQARHRIYLLGMAILLIGGGMIAYGAHHGGSLVYHYGTGVRMPATEPMMEQPSGLLGRLEAAVPPMELHATLAGIVFALVAVSLGLSVRRSNVAWENRLEEQKAVAAGYRPAGQTGNLLSIPTIYPGRFWVIAMLLAMATAGTGLIMFGAWRPSEILSQLRTDRLNDVWRPVVHVYLALSLITLTLVLAILIRFWPRRRFIMGVLSTLLVLIVMVQAWTGILMLFDGPEGTLMHFNPPAPPRMTVPDVLPLKTPVAPATAPAVPATLPTTTTATTTTAPAPAVVVP